MAIERVLTQFEKGGKYPIAEYRLIRIELKELQDLFEESPEDPMYHSYEVVTDRQVRRLQQAAGIEIDRSRYDYFVEAYLLQ